MNIYNDDVIFLSEEYVNTFMSSLIADKESLSNRDDFIADIKQNISFFDNGSIVVDIPDIDFDNSGAYEPVQTVVNTRKINISVNVSITLNTFYHGGTMRSYDGTLSDSDYKYSIKEKAKENKWNTSSQELSNVA